MKKIFFCFFVFLLLSPDVSLLHSNTLAFSNFLPKVVKQDDGVIIRIDTVNDRKDFYLYYRIPGLKKFQVRKMKKDKNGKIYYRLSTKNIYGKKIEYFFLEQGSSPGNTMSPVFTLNNFTKKSSPEIYFMNAAAITEPGEEEEKNFSIKIEPSLSTGPRLYDNSENPDEAEKIDTGINMRIYGDIHDEKDSLGVDFDSTFTYLNNPSDTESKVSLSSMMVMFKKGSHKFAAGDLSIFNTEFTTSNLNRRGLFYELDGKNLYLSSFFTDSQQKIGFGGFGLPASEAGIFGATAGFNILAEQIPVLKLRGSFLVGKDNLESKTMVLLEEVPRQGSMFSAWGEFNLFEEHVVFRGEYARSDVSEAAVISSTEKKKNEALGGEININFGAVYAGVDYQKVEADFNSIANLLLQNDRKGLNSNIGINVEFFSLDVNYSDEKTSLSSTIYPMLHTRTLNANLSLSLSSHLRVGANIGTNNLDYDESTGMQYGGSDMDTHNYSANFDYMSGANMVSLKFGKTESDTFTSNIDGSAALNLGFGDQLTLNSSLSYQENTNLLDESISKIYNIFLYAEISFVPQVFTLSMSGSLSKNKNSLNDDSSYFSGTAGLNFYMSKIFKSKIQPVLSFKGRYRRVQYGAAPIEKNAAFFLQFDLLD